MTKPPWRPLNSPLSMRERGRVQALGRQLAGFARTLEGFPSPRTIERQGGLPDATPFVSLYAAGRLRGCYGNHQGGPTERLLRAFLAALHDGRFGGCTVGDSPFTIQVSYLRHLRSVAAERIAETLEPGSHGIGLLAPDRPPCLLLPQVAAESGLNARTLLDCLAQKAGLSNRMELTRHRLFVFRAESVIVRDRQARRPREGSAIALGATWLSRLVSDDGAIAFALDAHTGARATTGLLAHGRAAMVIRALDVHGRHQRIADRARTRLREDIQRGLRGGLADWPETSDRIAGTLALATLSGLDLRGELRAYLDAHPDVAASPWHAAQCVAALGPAAPTRLWRACTDDLTTRPWAPWTAIAARVRQDGETLSRTVPALVTAMRPGGAFAGGASVTEIPELALTALVVEALDGLPTREARAAALRGRRFLRRWQLRGDGIPGGLDPAVVAGAFPASPVSFHLRADITAHALLALSGVA